jgi:hypothetical protein
VYCSLRKGKNSKKNVKRSTPVYTTKALPMESLSVFVIKILQILARRYSRGCTFEELTALAAKACGVWKSTDGIADERENQAKLLDALLWMHSEGCIFLNPDNDHSLITIKGLMLINNKTLWN